MGDAARTLSDEQLAGLVDAVADELERRKKARRRQPAPDVVLSEVDMQRARQLARRFGLVDTKRGRR